MHGGEGDDYISATSSDVQDSHKYFGEEGNDILVGSKAVDIFDCGDGVDVIYNYRQGDSTNANCEIVIEVDSDVNVDTPTNDLTLGPKDDADGGIGDSDNDNSTVKTLTNDDLTLIPSNNTQEDSENDDSQPPLLTLNQIPGDDENKTSGDFNIRVSPGLNATTSDKIDENMAKKEKLRAPG